MATQTTNVAPQSLAEATVVLNLELGRVSNRRRLSSSTDAVETEIDRDMLHLSIDLFDAEELRKCWNFLYALKARIRAFTVPSFLRGGMYLVKVEGVETVEAMLTEAQQEFLPLVQAFAEVIDERREESKERLGPAYDAGLYPSADQVISAFSVSWRWLSLSTPSSLKRISKAFFERERQKADENFQMAIEGINKMLASEAKKLVEHAIERLTPDEDGKAKQFKANSFNNITQFLEKFSFRNIGSSEELTQQIERMRGLMDGVSPEDVRTSDKLREDLSKGFERVAVSLDKLIVAKPTRFINIKKTTE